MALPQTEEELQSLLDVMKQKNASKPEMKMVIDDFFDRQKAADAAPKQSFGEKQISKVPTLGEAALGPLGGAITKTVEIGKEGLKDVVQGGKKQILEGQEAKKTLLEAGKSFVKGEPIQVPEGQKVSGEGFRQMIGGLWNTVSAPAAGVLMEGLEQTGLDEPVAKFTEKATQKISNALDEAGAEVGLDVTSPNWQEAKKQLGLVGEFGLEAAGIGAAGKAGKIASKLDFPEGLIKASDEVIEEITAKVGDKKAQLSASAKPKAIEIVDSTQKMDPAKTRDFKNMTGKTAGEWLVERGIIADRNTTISNLAERFSEAKNRLDSAVAEIGGKYKDPSVSKALDELAEYYKKTGDRKNLNVIRKRQKNLAGDGLTMDVILKTKRDLERNVKINYLKQNLPIEVKRLTNLDSDLRNFFVETAKKQGFDNLRDISLEIRDSKYLLDAIGDKLAKQLPNNWASLTDNMMLVAGAIDPKSLIALGIKKGLSAEGVKAWVANKLAGSPSGLDIPEAPMERIRLKAKQIEKLEEIAKDMMNKKKFEEFMRRLKEEADIKLLPEAESIQLGTSADPVEVRGMQLREGIGMFEGRKSPDVKNTKITLNNLLEEAKKFESADEFIRAQGGILYRGGTKDGKYLSVSKAVAEDFAKNRGGVVSEKVLLAGSKIIDYDNIPTARYKGINDYNMKRYATENDLLSFQDGKLEADYVIAESWAKKNGYDAVRFPTEGEIRVINENSVVPKSKLVDVWEKANK